MSAASMAQLMGSLLAVIGLIFAMAWLSRRLPLGGHARGGSLKLHGSIAVGARERVVLVQAGQDWLVLGVSPGHVRGLHVLDAPPEDFSQVLAAQDKDTPA